MTIIEVKENSIFEEKENLTVTIFGACGENLSETKLYKLSGTDKDTPEFLKNSYQLLNPIQLIFAKLCKKYGTNFSAIVSSPTSSGKTLLILIYIYYRLLKEDISRLSSDSNPLIVYVAPLKALVNEKYKEFKDVFGDVVEIRTGDVLEKTNITKPVLVCTPDYLSLVLRNKVRFVHNIDTVIIDEVHTIFSETRSPLDEILYFVKKNELKFLILSATIPQLETLSEYVNSSLVLKSKWTPVEIEYKYELAENLIKKSGIKEKLERDERFAIALLEEALSLLKCNQVEKVIIFVSSKALGWEILRQANSSRYKISILNDPDTPPFDIVKYEKEDLGIAFHCADLDLKERSKIERMFRKKETFLKILVSTKTLAYGVNLPADAAVIAVDLMKAGDYTVLRPNVVDCIQMAGRAGRFKITSKGYVSYVARGKKSLQVCLKTLNSPEKMSDLVCEENNLDYIIHNALFFSCLNKSKPEDCIKYSFLLYLFRPGIDKVYEEKRFLEEKGFIIRNQLTDKGKFSYSSGIPPVIVSLSEVLQKAKEKETDCIKREFLDVMSFIPFGYQGVSNVTMKYFLEALKRKSIFDVITTDIPSWHVSLKLLDVSKKVLEELEEQGFLHKVGQYLSFSTSILFQMTGGYYLTGLPKYYSDLGYNNPSFFIHLARSLISVTKLFRSIELKDVLVFLHAIWYRVLPSFLPGVMLFKILAESIQREFGLVKKAIVCNALNRLNLTIPYYKVCEFNSSINEVKSFIVKNKEDFLQAVEEIIGMHICYRYNFRKTVDEKRIVLENLKFFEEAIKILPDVNVDSSLAYDRFILKVLENLGISLETKRCQREEKHFGNKTLSASA